jgi:phosphoglycolate phosphatase-like HAD superfamily hydrolase
MPIDWTRVKGFCFDIDGTISDTDDAWVERITRTLHPLRFLFTRGDARSFARWLVMVTESPMNLGFRLLDMLSLDDNFARIYEKISKKNRKKSRRFILMKDARGLLEFLHERYPLSVVSARDHYSTHEFLTQFNLHSFFLEIVTSQTCERSKPFPQPVILAAQSMRLRPEDCLMVGDTTVDILAGKRAGAQTVGLLCGFGTEKELRRAGADLILNDLSELQELLQQPD